MSEPIKTTPAFTSAPGRKRPPGPPLLSSLDSAYAIGRDPMRFAVGMWHRYGDVVRFRLLFWPAYTLYHPDHVKHVLQENHRNYDKQFFMMKSVRPLFGNGLFTNDGESWLHQRRLMQPSFHSKRLASFGTLMTDATLALLERWQSAGSQPLDIPLEMMRLTQAAFPDLTQREREILGLIATGKSNTEIAEQLVLSPKTVSNHVSNIFHKLQVVDRAQAVLRARQAGLG